MSYSFFFEFLNDNADYRITNQGMTNSIIFLEYKSNCVQLFQSCGLSIFGPFYQIELQEISQLFSGGWTADLIILKRTIGDNCIQFWFENVS